TTALSPKPASSQVSLARCMGLHRTSSNAVLASTGLIRSANLRPLSVSGMSVVPVCCPLKLHAVSPCLIANTCTSASVASDVVGLGRFNPCRSRLLPPPPAGDLGHVVAVSTDVLLVIDELVADRLLAVSSTRPKLRHAIDDVAHQVEAVESVPNAHVERCRGGALFPVAVHVNVRVVRSPIGQPVNE